MYNYPGNGNFFVGPILEIEADYKQRVANKEVIPILMFYSLLRLQEGKR